MLFLFPVNSFSVWAHNILTATLSHQTTKIINISFVQLYLVNAKKFERKTFSSTNFKVEIKMIGVQRNWNDIFFSSWFQLSPVRSIMPLNYSLCPATKTIKEGGDTKGERGGGVGERRIVLVSKGRETGSGELFIFGGGVRWVRRGHNRMKKKL